MSNLKQDNIWSPAPAGLTIATPSRHGSGPAANEPRFERGIDRSEAVAILGVDPSRTSLDLWHEKQGLLIQPRKDPEPEETGIWPFMLEPLVATVYAKRTGHLVKRVSKTLRHPAYPWMGAAIRWEVESPEVGLLHCLQVGAKDMPLWEHGIPEPVRVDLMHLLAVTGQQAVDLAVLQGGRSVRVLRICRDEALIERVIEAEARFWGYVERGQMSS
ncbi:MAG: YqaJ viral recombinase family protein [Pseudomonadota bacterium]